MAGTMAQAPKTTNEVVRRAQAAVGGKTSPPPSAAVASTGQRQPLILKGPLGPRARCAEVVGGTAADCAAVCCCCPCGLVNLLVLAVVRLPVGLCRRALRALRRRKKQGKNKKKKAGLLESRVSSMDDDDDGGGFGISRGVPLVPESWPSKSPSMENSEMEKEMWGQFISAGFWRSPSQRD